MAVDPIARRFEKALFPIADTALGLRFGLWRRDARAHKRRQRTRALRRAPDIVLHLRSRPPKIHRFLRPRRRHAVVYYSRAAAVKRRSTLTRSPRWTMRQGGAPRAQISPGKDSK